METTIYLAWGIAALGLYVLLRLLAASWHRICWLLGRTLLGAGVLWLLRVLFAGLWLPLNPLSALIVGVLGLPGIGLLWALGRLLP